MPIAPRATAGQRQERQQGNPSLYPFAWHCFPSLSGTGWLGPFPSSGPADGALAIAASLGRVKLKARKGGVAGSSCSLPGLGIFQGTR
jgi:hypothetical protein